MANPIFPTLELKRGGIDSSLYRVKPENPAMVTDLEGGYVVSRKRHTRKPRLTFTFGYKEIGDADYKKLLDFYQAVGGGSVIFDWTDPVDKVVYQVRFSAEPDFQYSGIGATRLWSVQFEVMQA